MAVIPVDELAAPPVLEVRGVWQILLRNRKFVAGAAVVLVLLVVALVGSRFAGPQVLRTGAFLPKLGVGGAGWLFLGSTTLGQSIVVQLFQAIPNSMLVGLVAATIGTTVGALLGLMSGYFGGKVDAVLRVLIDVFLAVPGHREERRAPRGRAEFLPLLRLLRLGGASRYDRRADATLDRGDGCGHQLEVGHCLRHVILPGDTRALARNRA